jgi:hypothetical protein
MSGVWFHEPRLLAQGLTALSQKERRLGLRFAQTIAAYPGFSRGELRAIATLLGRHGSEPPPGLAALRGRFEFHRLPVEPFIALGRHW